jgi:gamma-glutamyltranspeptidase/glutathione hydrolase
MGGDMQAQGHLQFITRLALFNQNPQAVLDAPRFKVLNNREVCLEKNFPIRIVSDLETRGHNITYSDTAVFYGGGQAIYRLNTGKYVGASDPRRDGQAVGF